VDQGVAAAIMVDDVGTLNVPKTLFDRMRAGGVQIAVFNPVIGVVPALWQRQIVRTKGAR
jgi:hypothetical protein